MTYPRASKTLTVGIFSFAALATLLLAQSGPKAQPAGEISCQAMNYLNFHAPSSLTFDTEKGVVMEVRNSSGIFKAVVPKEQDGKPNADFDRIYSLIMKGFPNQLIEMACFKGTAVAGAEVTITSITLSPEPFQKVQICEGSRCARVTDAGSLWTTAR